MNYEKKKLSINTVILVANLGSLTLDIIVRNPIGILSLTIVVWYTIIIRKQIKHINELAYQSRLTKITAQQERWASSVARIELDIFGETYHHDRSYLPAYQENKNKRQS